MKQDISSLMDGELSSHEAARIIGACSAGEEHKDTWNLYHAIGEAIRGQQLASIERPVRVMEAIAKEPTVIGGPRRNLLETALGRVALAAAASVATIGVVSWIGTQGGAPGNLSSPVVAKGSPAGAIKPVAVTQSVPAPRPSIDVEYLSAHRQIPSLESYRPVANQGTAATR